MSSDAYAQLGQNCLYELSNWLAERLQDLEGGDVRRRACSPCRCCRPRSWPRGSRRSARCCSLPATFARIPLPVASMLQQVTKATPFCLASSICLATVGAVDRVEDHRVGALAQGGLERVLQLLGRAVGADRRGGPAEVRRALLDDVALDLAGLDATADEDDLLAGRDRLADRRGEPDASSGASVAFWASACALATPAPALPRAAEPPLEPSFDCAAASAGERGAEGEHARRGFLRPLTGMRYSSCCRLI